MTDQVSDRVLVWDGWRGLAILLVLVGHFTFSGWIWEERMGVDVFFALSGMLMSNILFVKKISLRDFYIRRISRIMPALIVFLFVSFVLSLFMKYEFQIIEFIASLFFVRTYYPEIPVYWSSELPTGHLWSLSVEEHSYVIMSLMTLFLYRWKGIAAALFSIYVLATIFCFYYWATTPMDQFASMLIRTETTIGFIAFSAAYFLFKKNRDISLPPLVSPLFFCVALLCYIKALPIWFTFLFCPVLLGIAINHLADSPKMVIRLLSSKPLVLLGVLSYSIYLWQQIFYKLHYALPLGQVTGLVLSLLFGVLSFYIVENPARKYINQRWAPNGKVRNTVLT